MADTMAFAVVGALLCSLTLLPVLCASFLRKHVKEPVVPFYDRVLRGYSHLLEVSLRHRAATLGVCLGICAASLLLVPHIGAEFMPHLDEGSLWVRATMPYTISFDEASKLGPQMRDILVSLPQVTTVANELGRPDDGTDPIGFFNDEYFVGLKPYNDPAWSGSIRTKAALIDAIHVKLEAFPGIIFNYTQPAEDAVDEAETGLKSSLAVKIFGTDLTVLESKGDEVQRALSGVPGIEHVSLVRELGQPSLTIEPDRAKLARYGLKVDVVPREHRAERCVEAMRAHAELKGAKVLFPRSEIAREVLADDLRKAGAQVTDVVAYRTLAAEPQREGDPDVYKLLLERQVDAVTFTSASSVRHFVKTLGEEQAPDLLAGTVVASIGPVTAEAAQQLGITSTIVPTEYTVPGLVEALVEHFRRG